MVLQRSGCKRRRLAGFAVALVLTFQATILALRQPHYISPTKVPIEVIRQGKHVRLGMPHLCERIMKRNRPHKSRLQVLSM